MLEAIERASVCEEDLARSGLYDLLARFLRAAPAPAVLAVAAQIAGNGREREDNSELGRALAALARAASAATPESAAEEYFNLFIGVGRGELIPYASYYVTGFLNERPLADLRDDLARLGIEQDGAFAEPEDHIAALCETMAGLIDGRFGRAFSLPEQRRFFETHIAPWAKGFFSDLEQAEAAVLYRPLGEVGRIFAGLETAGLAMDE